MRLSDTTLLKRLIGSNRLTDREYEVFNRMFEDLVASRVDALSQRQRTWAEGVYVRLELDADTANHRARAGQMPPLDYELMPKPLKPPGVGP